MSSFHFGTHKIASRGNGNYWIGITPKKSRKFNVVRRKFGNKKVSSGKHMVSLRKRSSELHQMNLNGPPKTNKIIRRTMYRARNQII